LLLTFSAFSSKRGTDTLVISTDGDFFFLVACFFVGGFLAGNFFPPFFGVLVGTVGCSGDWERSIESIVDTVDESGETRLVDLLVFGGETSGMSVIQVTLNFLLGLSLFRNLFIQFTFILLFLRRATFCQRRIFFWNRFGVGLFWFLLLRKYEFGIR